MKKTVISSGAERDSKISDYSEKNLTQSATYDLTDAIAEFHSRGKLINASTVILGNFLFSKQVPTLNLL